VIQSLDSLWAAVRQDAALASALRSGLYRPIGEVPEIWPLLARQGQQLSNREAEAVFRTLCLYAVHIQSVREGVDCHQSEGASIGSAIAQLTANPRATEGSRRDMSDAAAERRLMRTMGARSQAELVQTLSGLVRLMRDPLHPIVLDYSQLARDIFSWESLDGRERVRRHWGLDYARTAAKRFAEQNKQTNPQDETMTEEVVADA